MIGYGMSVLVLQASRTLRPECGGLGQHKQAGPQREPLVYPKAPFHVQ